MSKDKGGKNAKKAPSTEAKKSTSDYQNGKATVSKIEVAAKKKVKS